MKKKLTHFAFGLHDLIERTQDELKNPTGDPKFHDWATDLNLAEDLENLNHYLAEATPIIERYTFLREPAIKFIYLVNMDEIRIPLELKKILNQPYEGSTYKSYTRLHIEEPTLIIKNDKRAILSTIRRMEQIAGWVMDDYNNETDKVWTMLGLGGDDSVDYGGTYVQAICCCLRAWAYLEYKDSKFLKL